MENNSKRKSNRRERKLEAVILLLLAIIGTLFIGYMAIIKIVIPGFQMINLNQEIQATEDDAKKYQGYIDTTDMNQEVQELLDKRQQTWYENPDPMIRQFANSNIFMKVFEFGFAIIVVVILADFWYKIFQVFLPRKKRKKTNCRTTN